MSKWILSPISLCVCCLVSAVTFAAENVAPTQQPAANSAPSPQPAATPAAQATSEAPAAKPMTTEEFKAKIAADGISYDQTPDKITMTLDLNKTIPALPQMEKEGLLPTLTPAEIAKMPISISIVAVGISLGMELLHDLYSNNKTVAKTHVETYIIATGSTEKQLCFSYDIDRALYDKMDLNFLAPKPFTKMLPTFTYSAWCKAAMAHEGTT